MGMSEDLEEIQVGEQGWPGSVMETRQVCGRGDFAVDVGTCTPLPGEFLTWSSFGFPSL